MSWEKRNNNHYYYRKRRQGKRVISEYVGAGPLAETAAAIDHRRRQARQAERQARAAIDAIDADLDQICTLIQTLVHAHLLLGGYHTHKGQWRKARKEQK